MTVHNLIFAGPVLDHRDGVYLAVLDHALPELVQANVGGLGTPLLPRVVDLAERDLYPYLFQFESHLLLLFGIGCFLFLDGGRALLPHKASLSIRIASSLPAVANPLTAAPFGPASNRLSESPSHSR